MLHSFGNDVVSLHHKHNEKQVHCSNNKQQQPFYRHFPRSRGVSESRQPWSWLLIGQFFTPDALPAQPFMGKGNRCFYRDTISKRVCLKRLCEALLPTMVREDQFEMVGPSQTGLPLCQALPSICIPIAHICAKSPPSCTPIPALLVAV